MDSNQFTYWLQGFFEIAEPRELNPKQVQMIKDHLDLVFNKVTPNRVSIPEIKKEEVKVDLKDLFKPVTPQTSISQPTGVCWLCGKNHPGQLCPSNLIITC